MPRRPQPRSVGRIRLRVVRGPDASGRWYWRATVHKAGHRNTVWCGWGTTEEADLEAARRLTREAPVSTSDVRTVEDLLAVWLGAVELRADLERATVSGYGAGADRLRAVVGDVPLDRLTSAALDRYRDVSLRAGRKARGVAWDLKILRAAWRWGAQLGVVPARDPPTSRVRLPELRRPKATADQVAELLERAEDRATRLHLLLLWATGCRVSEIARLRRKDVDLPWLTVTGKGRTRRVPLRPEVAAEVAAWLEGHPGPEDGWMLGLRPESARQLAWRVIRDAGMAWSPHALRRAAVDRLYRSGVDVGTAGQLLGHSPEVALRHYREVAEGDLLDAIRHSGMGGLPRAGEVVEFHGRAHRSAQPRKSEE